MSQSPHLHIHTLWILGLESRLTKGHIPRLFLVLGPSKTKLKFVAGASKSDVTYFVCCILYSIWGKINPNWISKKTFYSTAKGRFPFSLLKSFEVLDCSQSIIPVQTKIENEKIRFFVFNLTNLKRTFRDPTLTLDQQILEIVESFEFVERKIESDLIWSTKKTWWQHLNTRPSDKSDKNNRMIKSLICALFI